MTFAGASTSVFGALPVRVKELVAGAPISQGGVDGETGLCWLISGARLLVWKLDWSVHAHTTVLSLPEDAGSDVLVELVPQPSGCVSVVVVSPAASSLIVWPDAAQPFQTLSQALQGETPAALAAAALTADEGSAEGIIAVVGFQDGGMQRVEAAAGGSLLRSRLLPTGDSRKTGRGFLPLLSSAVKAAYAETFYPTAGRQALCSGEAVVSLRLLRRRGGSQDLLVLTSDSLEQWRLLPWAAPSEPSERCEASLRLAPLLKRKPLGMSLERPILLSLPQGSQSQAVAVAAGSRGESEPHVYALLHFCLTSGETPRLEASLALTGCPVTPRGSDKGAGLHQLLIAPSGAALLRQPGGAVWLIAGVEGGGAEAEQVPGEDVALGCGLTSAGDSWLLLDPFHGLLSVRVVASNSASPGPSPPLTSLPSGPLNEEAQAKVYEELNAALAQLSAGRRPTALGYTLEKLGAFGADGADNAVARYSRDLIDRLPKHWGDTGGAPRAGEAPQSLSTAQQLEQKMAQHDALISLLEEGGCLRCLRPSALRILLDNAEKCSALLAIRHLDNRLPHRLNKEQMAILQSYGEQSGWVEGGTGQSGGERAEALRKAQVSHERLSSFLAFRGQQPLHEAVASAGHTIQAAEPLLAQRDPSEVFYARPSVAVQQFFASIDEVLQDDLRITHQKASLAAVRQLLDAADAALLQVGTVREDLQRCIPKAFTHSRGLAEPWSAGAEIRCGLQALVECCLERQPPIAQHRSTEQAAEVKGLLYSATDRLLAAFAEADAALYAIGGSSSAAKLARLREEYNSAKHQALEALFEEAKWEAEQSKTPYSKNDLMREVERMSEHHCSYPQVMDICEALGEPARLHNLMGSCGPPGDFAAYVIKRLHDEGRDSELLKLPRQFDKPILEFLQAFPELHWKHQMRMQQYSGASCILADLASSRGIGLQAKQRLLALEHLCHLATAAPGLSGALGQEEIVAANQSYSELVLLDIQKCIGLEGGRAMDKSDLVKAALDAGASYPEAYAYVLTIFAVAGPGFMLDNEDQMKSAWLQIVGATDWEMIEAKRSTEADPQWMALVAATPLVLALQQASCQYGLAQSSARVMKDWLRETVLSGEMNEAALRAVEFALQEPLATAGDPDGGGIEAMEH